MYLSGMWLGGPKTYTRKTWLKDDWTMCSKYGTPSRLNIQHNWGGGLLYDHLTSTGVFTLIMNKIFI